MGRSKSKISRKIRRRLSILRRCILRLWNQILMCSIGKPIRYRMMSLPAVVPSASLPLSSAAGGGVMEEVALVNRPLPSAAAILHNSSNGVHRVDSDLVALKISLLGDSNIGKTSFLAKYVGDETDEGGRIGGGDGLNLMGKILQVGGARISYTLWEVDSGDKSRDLIPAACKDSVAILIMFDLTSRVTLNGVMRWYQEARKWNQTAIPILIGTKFDDFIQLPIDLQWTIASQARAYAKALNATLFFSSATYNINVNKIFKFITAKLFDLPWSVERNLNIGEPIIDF
ncbi:unnamed protein product [Linum trigynum]|uniref:Septum-promoting GTP-binding protein 1 n=1 Tax=Linum trigynum TaxID=586398 RepID=A0AAV2F6U1_9ROSI